MQTDDEAEFTEFATRNAPRLRRTAYLMCNDWHRAEDAAQEVLVKMHQRWGRLDRDVNLPAYANRAVINTVLGQARLRRHREFPGFDGADVEVAPLARDLIKRVDDRDLMFRALAKVPPGQRACVLLRHYADLSVEQTADILGIGISGVRSQTSRGLAHLRAMLSPPERHAS